MKINELDPETGTGKTEKLEKARLQFEKLLMDLRKRELPDGLVMSINKSIDEINSSSIPGNDIRKVILIKKNQNKILRLLRQEKNLVPKNYYRYQWLAPGMAAFGIPIGAALGAGLGSMAFLGLGLPIGLAIGTTIGSQLDKKANREGRQLDVGA